MVSKVLTVLAAIAVPVFGAPGQADPCVAVGGQKWVAPSALRACFQSIPVNATTKSNILEVVTKTLAFDTSINYQIRAPEPFTQDVHENVLADLARIGAQRYASEFDMHIDLSRSVKRLMDVLTDARGQQAVHISPEAFSVASVEFADEISVWQNALPGALKGQLASLSAAKVIAINGADPWVAVNANAQIAGSFQALGTRQNGFFSSYARTDAGWVYSMGQFAQQSLPLNDQAILTVQRVNSTRIETFAIPYRSRIGAATVAFTDKASLIQKNCVATAGTNGVNANANDQPSSKVPGGRFAPIPLISPMQLKKQPISLSLNDAPQSDIVLPPVLQPPAPLAGTGVAQFYTLAGGKTGVLALGSFAEASFDVFETTLLTGLQTLKSSGATQLIVDVTNNGGGFICIAHWLHRIIAGPKSTTVPQAGLDTKARAGPLAQLIVQKIVEGADPNQNLLYNSANWAFANGTKFPPNIDWLQPPVNLTINGHQDSFSQRLGQECQPFDMTAPDEPLFDTSKVAIVSNGRCASSCSLFSITMAKEEGAKMIVFGGNKAVQQEYCGTVGGQSSDFSTMDTEVKTTGLKSNPLAPPDFLTNSVQGITWRLGFGIQNTQQPEEWQDHPADINFPLTADTVNNPLALWTAISKSVFGA